MQYSVCVSSLFYESEARARGLRSVQVDRVLPAVRAAGCDTYEFWGWGDQDVEAIARSQREQGLRLAAFCAPPVPLTDPGKRGEFLDALRETLKVADRLGCGNIITLAGQALEGVPREEQHASIVAGLRASEGMLRAAGCTLVLEPLNTRLDHPGYYLETAAEAFGIVGEVGSPHVRVLYDIYHQHITERSPVEPMARQMGLVGHIHLAGYPGRHEPWLESEIDWKAILSAAKKAGYGGLVGLEYFPSRPDVTGELARFLRGEGSFIL